MLLCRCIYTIAMNILPEMIHFYISLYISFDLSLSAFINNCDIRLFKTICVIVALNLSLFVYRIDSFSHDLIS